MPSWQTHMVNGLFRVFVKHRKFKDLKRLRKGVEKIDSYQFKFPVDVSVKDQEIDNVPCQWIAAPGSNKSHIILYFHGGGFCIRTPILHAAFVSRLCRSTGTSGLVPDYRLAPEHPFPAAHRDCFKVYQWLLDHGFNSKNIIIAGDSAGGNLTLSTLIQIRDAKIPRPAGGVMISPATDMTLQGESFVENKKKDAMFTLQTVRAMRQAYLKNTSPADPIASPLYAQYHNMPPLFFQVSDSELLRDSSLLAAQKAQAYGIEVVLDIYHGMPHCFSLLGFLPESRKAVANVVKFINARVF